MILPARYYTSSLSGPPTLLRSDLQHMVFIFYCLFIDYFMKFPSVKRTKSGIIRSTHHYNLYVQICISNIYVSMNYRCFQLKDFWANVSSVCQCSFMACFAIWIFSISLVNIRIINYS